MTGTTTFKAHRAAAAAFLLALAPASAAMAGIVFQTGNIQWTNVNIAAEQSAMTIEGEVDHLGVAVYFNGYGATPLSAPVMLHGQHGVAFVEAFSPTDFIYRLTIRAQAGYAFSDMDWKLDAVPPFNGLVTFTAYDALNAVIPLNSGSSTFAFDHNGENPFHAHADASTPIAMLVIDSTVPIQNLKQLSVNLVPGPSALAAGGLFALALGHRRRRTRAV